MIFSPLASSITIDYNASMAQLQKDKLTLKIAAFGKAMADPSRLIIMQLCCKEGKKVTRLTELTGLAQSTVSHHLAVLREANLVHVQHKGKSAIYTLDQQAFSSCCQLSSDLFAPDEPENNNKSD
jgi:DNA-binding transcriptional ArsR family regulator